MSKDGKAGAENARLRKPIFKCCNGFRAQHRTLVMKAKSKAGTKAVKHALVMQRIMTLLEMGVVADLNTGMAVFKRRIDRNKLEKLIEEGEIDKAMALIPWDNLPEDIERIEGNLETAVLRASEGSIASLSSPAKTAIIGTANPRIRRFIEDQVGNLVLDITSESRKSIRNAITASFDQGLTPRQTARLIQSSVGLTEKQNIRLMNTQMRLFQDRDRATQRLEQLRLRGQGNSKSAIKLKAKIRNLSDSKIQKRTEVMASRLQKQRNITIARTELTRSVNQGQVETWTAAANEGLIDRDRAMKVWVVVPDDRLSNICASLDGTKAALDDKFVVPQNGEVLDGPPAHPNCRSALALITEE